VWYWFDLCSERKKHPSPHQVWGAEHLLRLLVLLPRLITGEAPTNKHATGSNDSNSSSGSSNSKQGASEGGEEGGEAAASSSSSVSSGVRHRKSTVVDVEEEAKIVEEYVNGLLLYMDEKKEELFSQGNYVDPGPKYGMDVARVTHRY